MCPNRKKLPEELLMTVRHVPLFLSLVLAAATGCSKKPDAPVVVEPPAKTAPVQTKPTSEAHNAATVKFEFDVRLDPRAVVTLGGNDYSLTQLEQAITLKPGEHTIVINRPDLDFGPAKFSVEKGQRRIVRIYD